MFAFGIVATKLANNGGQINLKSNLGQVLPARQRTEGRHTKGDGVQRRTCADVSNRLNFGLMAQVIAAS